MDTRTLSVFLSVAETLNFSRSGELLHMSVSAVSRTIKRLEDRTGYKVISMLCSSKSIKVALHKYYFKDLTYLGSQTSSQSSVMPSKREFIEQEFEI